MIMKISPYQARQMACMTLAELAKAAGIALSTVWLNEKLNRWPPRPSTRRKLAKALGIDPATLATSTPQ